jgi:hypothetical protein
MSSSQKKTFLQKQSFMGVNRNLLSQRPATNHLSHGKVFSSYDTFATLLKTPIISKTCSLIPEMKTMGRL